MSNKELAAGSAYAGESPADHNGAELEALADRVLTTAKKLGADSGETAVGRSQGFSVNVRMGEIETIEHNRDKSLVVTVYFGHKSGSASTSDFSAGAVDDTVRAACTIASYTASDECAGLADAEHLASEFRDLGLEYPWEISVAQAIDIATECEDAARSFDPAIRNSEGAAVNTHQGSEVYANTHGFVGCSSGTRHGISCSVIGEQDDAMQRDYWYSAARDPVDLESAKSVGKMAARRTIRRLGARKIKSTQCPVLYEAPAAASLLSHFIGAVRGSALYRKASFLLDKLGTPVFADGITIGENPYLLKAVGSANYDGEGVTTRTRDIVQAGLLTSYVLDSYSARKLGMQTTGNAGGVRNLSIESGPYDLPALIKKMDTGLLVTELIGSGVNNVTGDYSRGIVGFWVENGVIQHPVEELTIAGNLKEMFRQIVAVGSDVDTRGNIRSGSILLEKITVAGD
jgi:PmbA protein